MPRSVLDHAGDHVPLALHRTDYDGLAVPTTTAIVAATTLPLVLVLGLPADEGFVHFNVADQLLELDVAKRNANLVAHQVRRVVGAEAHA